MPEHKPRIVFVSSPYRGDVDLHVNLAIKAAKQVFDAGHVPIVPHLYITRILDDDIPREREMGITAALELLARCDEMWVFGPPSAGMQMEIDEADRIGVPYQRLDLPRRT